MRNKTKATLTLAACAILAAGTLPASPFVNFFTGSAGVFLIGLLNHGFIAATIGGLADWFAVTALFHKPLGISYRTEILKRNRKRISDAVIEFVGEDLLNTKNIMETLNDENAAKLLIDFLENYNGRQKVKNLVGEIVNETFAKLDAEKISREVAPLIESEVKNVDVQKIIAAATQVVTKESNSRKILIMLLETARRIINSKHMQQEIFQKIKELRVAYEGDSMGRAMVLSSLNLTDEKILSILNENVESKISATIDALNANKIVNTEKDKIAQDLLKFFSNAVNSATKNLDTEKFQAEFENLFNAKVDVAGYIQDFLAQGDKIWRAEIDKIVDRKITEFIYDTALQQKFDALVKGMIENLLNEYHGEIPALISEKLNKFDDDKLTEFVESRVSDDLQMIRINGSVCGALAGMFLYIVSQIIAQIVG
ncbi:MAG: DUF445 family protein [Selenomonadaceae bacterium]|nr:DUF445 family protein [Selenomonadaceae bacterium]